MPVCYFGRACRRTRPICLSMLSCRTPLTARCCASRVVPCTLASLKPLRASSPISADNQPELLARHYTEAGLIEKAAGLWRTAGQRSLARAALLEGAEQIKRALDQIATLPATPDLRGEEIKLQVAFANALSPHGRPCGWQRALRPGARDLRSCRTRSAYDAFWPGCRGDPLVISFAVCVATWLSGGFAQ